MIKKKRDFEKAREYARSLGLKNRKGWLEHCKSGQKPTDIPIHPDQRALAEVHPEFGEECYVTKEVPKEVFSQHVQSLLLSG